MAGGLANAQSQPRSGRPRPRSTVAGFGQRQSLDRITAEIRDCMSLRKTLVVWLIEQTTASASLADSMADEIPPVLRDLRSSDPEQLQMAVVGYGNEVNLATPEPVHDAAQLQAACSRLKAHQGDEAHVFAAFQKAIEKFLLYRDRGYEVIFVVAGSSSGDDADQADAVISSLKPKAVAVFGIGPTIPFGAPHTAGRRGSFQASTLPTTKRSVESLHPERIQLALSDGQGTQDLDDSGYGPFGLERLCRQTGGRFFRLHDTSPAGWEADPLRGDIKFELRIKYAPDYAMRRALRAVAGRE